MIKIYGEPGSSILRDGKYITFNAKGYIEIEDEKEIKKDKKEEIKEIKEDKKTIKNTLKSNIK